jgi:23S rRNA pseudouridine1911/1915/1917 synthase
MLNRGYAYTTIISSRDHGRTLLSHLASLYPHSTRQGWRQNLDDRQVTVDGVTAIGIESLISGQTLVWNRPPWIEPDSPQHFEVLFDDAHLLAVNKPGGLPTLPGGGFMENTLLRLVQKQDPNANPVHRLGRATTGIVLFAKTPHAASKLSADWNTPEFKRSTARWLKALHSATPTKFSHPSALCRTRSSVPCGPPAQVANRQSPWQR